jgi:hypothetical protein
MSTRKWRITRDADGPANVPVSANAERTESAWLLAREHDPRAPAPSAEIAADYAELEELLSTLSPGPLDERWLEDVLRAASAATPALRSRPWWRTTISRWVMGGALATAAITVMWLRPPRASEPVSEPAIEVAIRHTSVTRSGPDEVVIGDQLVVTTRPRKAGDLRVYRSDGTLIAKCPNGPGCKAGSHGEQRIEITLDAPLQYQVILADGMNEALPDGTLDVYEEAARAVNARITTYHPIDVH